jgi:hypothetical protein
MKSLQHVWWRGALALSLVAVGIGSGVGMAPAEQAAGPANCAGQARMLVAARAAASAPAEAGDKAIVLRRALNPAG